MSRQSVKYSSSSSNVMVRTEDPNTERCSKKKQQNTHEEEKKGVSTALGKSRQASNPGVGRAEKTKNQKLSSSSIVPLKNKKQKKTLCLLFLSGGQVGWC